MGTLCNRTVVQQKCITRHTLSRRICVAVSLPCGTDATRRLLCGGVSTRMASLTRCRRRTVMIELPGRTVVALCRPSWRICPGGTLRRLVMTWCSWILVGVQITRWAMGACDRSFSGVVTHITCNTRSARRRSHRVEVIIDRTRCTNST